MMLTDNEIYIVKEYSREIEFLRKQIVELTEENARLKHFDLEAMRGKADSYKELCSKYLEENKRLIEENERLKSENDMLLNIKNLNIDKVIADTVRKMQERLKMYFGTYTLGYKIPLKEALKVINQIAKEMSRGEG